MQLEQIWQPLSHLGGDGGAAGVEEQRSLGRLRAELLLPADDDDHPERVEDSDVRFTLHSEVPHRARAPVNSEHWRHFALRVGDTWISQQVDSGISGGSSACAVRTQRHLLLRAFRGRSDPLKYTVEVDAGSGRLCGEGQLEERLGGCRPSEGHAIELQRLCSLRIEGGRDRSRVAAESDVDLLVSVVRG